MLASAMHFDLFALHSGRMMVSSLPQEVQMVLSEYGALEQEQCWLKPLRTRDLCLI